jgi:hypothetical protein
VHRRLVRGDVQIAQPEQKNSGRVHRPAWRPTASFKRVTRGSMLWSQFSAIFANFRRQNWRFF